MVPRLAPLRMLGLMRIAIILGASFGATPARSVDFSREIQPILASHCFRCHGPDDAQRQAGLRLDNATTATAPLASGKRAVVAGNPAESELIRRINSNDPAERMPPPETGDTLTDAQRTALHEWIAAGANWKIHWAFVAPKRPSLPDVPTGLNVRNPIDRFVIARLQSPGIAPAHEADRETLLRRATLTLTGLPPTPSEVDAFLADTQPDAYERAVDRLLHSPRYGEHLARPWLDAARYGDTHGLHLDNVRSMWPFRDWVIEALNDNMPFDQFTLQQMAGDLLPHATIPQRVATGFHRCNVTTNEEGSIDAEFFVRYAMDRVETTAATWMGLTLNCAACHDHKYDPISQREYYQLFAYFSSVTDQARDGDVLIPPPSVRVPDRVQRQKHARLTSQLADIHTRLARLRASADASFEAWGHQYARDAIAATAPRDSRLLCTFENDDPAPSDPPVRVPADIGRAGEISGNAAYNSGRRGRALRLGGNARATFSIPTQPAQNIPAAWTLSLGIFSESTAHVPVLSVQQTTPDDRQHHTLHVDSDGRLVITFRESPNRTTWQLCTAPSSLTLRKWHTLVLSHDGSAQPTGVAIYVDGDKLETKPFDAPPPPALEAATNDRAPAFVLMLGGDSDSKTQFVGMLDDVRFFDHPLTDDQIVALSTWDPIYELLQLPASTRNPTQQAQLRDAFLAQESPEFNELQAQRRTMEQQRTRLESQFASALVLQQQSQPSDVHLRIRGQYDQLGDRVEPGVPASLPPLPPDAPPNRLALARWLTDPSNPLTARVIVNRIWQHHFGLGLVATPEDFGSRGERPSHPELLDWLAVELRDSGWDLKHLHRLIVTSATFRQSSQASRDAYQRDPENRLLARGPRFRLDAEVIRDTALASSGLLVERLGGPSGKVYQPAGLWEAIGYTKSNTAQFTQDHGASLYRRSLYTFWKRTSPPPTMQILNAPSREVCTLRRQRSNTPTAALALLNDVQFVEAARHFAQRLLLTDVTPSAQPTTQNSSESLDHQRLTLAWRMATGRHPEAREVALLHDLLKELRNDFGSDVTGASELIRQGESPHDESLDAAELAAWTVVCNTLLNLDEVIQQW